MYTSSLPGLRSLNFSTASEIASAAPEPLPWVTKRKPWSMAAFNVFRLSCGEPLLSNPTISNFTPAGLFLPDRRSATNCQLLSWFCPTLANGPDRGSMKAMRTVWPAVSFGGADCCACALTPQARRTANVTWLIAVYIDVSRWFRQGAGYLFCAVQRSGIARKVARCYRARDNHVPGSL